MMITQDSVKDIMLETTPIIAVASGKGGAGKTSLTLNLAAHLVALGKKTLVFDADFGLANVDVQLGMTTSKDLSNVLNGEVELKDIVQKSDRGFYIIPGRSGSQKLPFTTALERRNVLKQLREIAKNYDVVMLDVGAGVDEEVLNFANFADRTLLITTPDPSSLTDAYALVKLLKIRHDKTNCEVVINNAGSEIEGQKTFDKINTAAEKFLHISLPLVGVVPYDRQFASAVKMQTLAFDAFPTCPASERLRKIAKTLI